MVQFSAYVLKINVQSVVSELDFKLFNVVEVWHVQVLVHVLQNDKIITAESSGIMIAQAMATHLGIPFIYAKKKRPLTMTGFFAASSYSFTKQESTTLYVSNEVLLPGERLLLADDFFAVGSTYKAIEQIVEQAEASLVGAAVIINKSQRRDIESILILEELMG